MTPIWLASIVMGPAVKGMKTDGARRLIAIFSAMAVLNVVLYWMFIPYRTQQRFMLQALGLAVVPLAATLDCSRWLRHGAAVLLAVHLLTPQAWPFAAPNGSPPWDLTPLIPNAMGDPLQLFGRIGKAIHPEEAKRAPESLPLLVGIVLCSLVMVASWRRLPGRSPRSRLRGPLIVVSSVLFVTFGYLDVWRELTDPRAEVYPAFADFFTGWLQLEARSGMAGSRVAYAGTNVCYYLMGKGLRNDVRYVNVDRHRLWLMHDYHREAMKHGQGSWPNSRPGWDRSSPDFRAWVDNLEVEGIQLLVVTRVNSGEGRHNVADFDHFPIERQWADAHPECFEPLYGQRENDPWFRLYRFRRERSGPLHDDSQAPERGSAR